MPVLIKMIKNQIFQKLQKCDTEIRNEQMLPEKNVTNGIAVLRVVTNLQLFKNMHYQGGQ